MGTLSPLRYVEHQKFSEVRNNFLAKIIRNLSFLATCCSVPSCLGQHLLGYFVCADSIKAGMLEVLDMVTGEGEEERQIRITITDWDTLWPQL